MEDFPAFEDDLFLETKQEKVREPKVEPPYKAKIDNALWFISREDDVPTQSLNSNNNCTPSNGSGHIIESKDEKVRQRQRYHIDYLYSVGNYAEASKLALALRDDFAKDKVTVRDMNEILSRCKMKLEDYEVALTYASLLVQDSGQNSFYHFTLGKVLFHLGRYIESVNSLHTAIILQPLSVDSYLLLSRAYLCGKNFGLAAPALERCQALTDVTLRQKRPPWDRYYLNLRQEVSKLTKLLPVELPPPLFSNLETVALQEKKLIESASVSFEDNVTNDDDDPLKL